MPDAAVNKDELPDLFKELLEGDDKGALISNLLHGHFMLFFLVTGHSVAKEVTNACLLIVRVMLGLQSNTGPSPLRTRSMKAKSTEGATTLSKQKV
jgi:hypothetical protein